MVERTCRLDVQQDCFKPCARERWVSAPRFALGRKTSDTAKADVNHSALVGSCCALQQTARIM